MIENEIGWLFGLPDQEEIYSVILAVFVYHAALLGQRAIDKNKLIECAILGGVLLLTLDIGASYIFGVYGDSPVHRDIGPFLFHALTFLMGVAGVCFFAVLHKYTKDDS